MTGSDGLNVWPFDDSPELGVFVTRRVFEGQAIDIVDHDHDGDWEFLTHDEVRDSDGDLNIDDTVLLHFHHVVEHHPEVLQFADLPLGYSAVRESDGTWQRYELERSDDE